MGKLYDSGESRRYIWPFIQRFKLEDSLGELREPDPERYATFNEFFSRAISEDARPLEGEGMEGVVNSVADCRMVVFQDVDLATQYSIKGFGFTLGKLLGSEELAREFDGGSIAIARLAPQDYHRWHSPISGTVQSIAEIPGAYYTVNPQAITSATTLDVFCENRRSVMIVKRTLTARRVVIIAVGAMLVGSIRYVVG
jgi:phosphatidylserine decarboxylase